MVEILCPHCEEEIGLDDDAVGEFSCPLCDEEFTWDGLLDDGDSADFYDRKSFWIGLGIPNLLIIMAWCAGAFLDLLHDRAESPTTNYSGVVIISLLAVSFLSWIALLIHGIRVKNKAMWKGALTGIALAPFVLVLGIWGFVIATDWSLF